MNDSSVLVGGYRMDGGATTVWFRTPEVAFPEICACCETEETLGIGELSLWGDKGELPYPICTRCSRHARWSMRLVALALGVGFGLLGALYVYDPELVIGLLERKPIRMGTFGVVIALTVAAGVWYACTSALRRKSCESDSDPIYPDLESVVMPWNKDNPPPLKTSRAKASRALEEQAGEAGFGLVLNSPRFAARLLEQHGVDRASLPEVGSD